MGQFLKQIQNGSLKQPTQIGFDLNKWDRAKEADKSFDSEDERIFKCGQVIFDKLELIRSSLKKYPEINFSKNKLIRLYAGIVNRDHKLIMLKTSCEKGEEENDGVIHTVEIPAKKVMVGEEGRELNASAALQTSVTALKYPIYDLYQNYETLKKVKPKSKDDAKKNLHYSSVKINLASLYHVIEVLWQECLWNGWRVVENDSKCALVAPATKEYCYEVVGEYRAALISMEEAIHAQNYWSKLSTLFKKMMLPKQIISNVNRKKGKVTFETSTPDLEDVPFSVSSAILIQETYLKELFEKGLPNFDGITCLEILDVWYQIVYLAQSIYKTGPNDITTGSPQQMLGFAPELPVKELIDVIHKNCRISNAKIKSIIKVLCQGGDPRKDPWNYPLLELDGGLVTLIIPAVLTTNITRLVESLFEVGGASVELKGQLYEGYIRKEFQRKITASEILKCTHFIDRDFTFRTKGEYEEIDFVWIIGGSIVLGELKSTFHAATPLELMKVKSRLREGANQINRKADFVEANLDEFLKQVGIEAALDPKKYRIIKFVLNSTPLLSGYKFKGVPVIDSYILMRYADGHIFKNALMSGDEIQKQDREDFYTDIETAETNLVSYLNKPEIISNYSIYLENDAQDLIILSGNDPLSGYLRLCMSPKITT